MTRKEITDATPVLKSLSEDDVINYVSEYTETLLTLAAKKICFHCRNQGLAVKLANRSGRYHVYTENSIAECRAGVLYLED